MSQEVVLKKQMMTLLNVIIELSDVAARLCDAADPEKISQAELDELRAKAASQFQAIAEIGKELGVSRI